MRQSAGTGEGSLSGPEVRRPVGGGAAVDQWANGRAQRPRRRRHRRLHYLARGTLERRRRSVPGVDADQALQPPVARRPARRPRPRRAPLEVSTTDRYGRTFRAASTFEVVDRIPEMGWNGGF